jgi:YVTN family beta-propeller protein
MPQGGTSFSSIWVANDGSNTVSKLQASTGQVLGTFIVGTTPYGVAFDGANVWVSNARSDNVMKLRASDGKLLGTFAVGTVPLGITFDGPIFG